MRVRERDRAIARMGSLDSKTAEIIDDLTRVLAKKLLTDATFSIRESAGGGRSSSARALVNAITQGNRVGGAPWEKK